MGCMCLWGLWLPGPSLGAFSRVARAVLGRYCGGPLPGQRWLTSDSWGPSCLGLRWGPSCLGLPLLGRPLPPACRLELGLALG